MIYIVDLFLEGDNDFGECNDASLTIYDGNYKLSYCGLQQPELVLFSCANIVQFNFTSTRLALGGYRGFKVYFKTIGVPIGWPCGNSTATTTMRPPPPTTLVPPSLQSKSIFNRNKKNAFFLSSSCRLWWNNGTWYSSIL
jgi:hypothetical protein